MPPIAAHAARTLATLPVSSPTGLSGTLAGVITVTGFVAAATWIIYRFGPAIARLVGIATWWAAWACGSQGALSYMAVLLVLGTALWATGTIWYAKRRGHWPSPISARLLDRNRGRATPHRGAGR